MQVQINNISSTELELTISAGEAYLEPIKLMTLEHLKGQVKIPGFREGKAPAHIIEKNIDQSKLQAEFLQHAVDKLYSDAMNNNKIRPIANPEIQIKKFVPFSELEFSAKVQVIGKVILPKYKNIKKSPKTVTVTEKDVLQVLNNLQAKLADKKEVERSAKLKDEVWIDFEGKDEKGQLVNGASGKDYPLILGSNTFIPGFEDNLIGLKKGDNKSFDVKFPKDYGVSALQSKKVTFSCKVNKVEERIEPKIDDELAKKSGPFQNLKELKEDIKKQLKIEKQNESERNFENELIKEIVQKSKVDIPKQLIDNQAEVLLQDLKQNLVYRGQTYQEYLSMQSKSEEQYYKEIIVPEAQERVKAGLVLSEISEQENINLTPEEVDIRIQVLKSQYKDEQTQKELDKPENRQDIASRLLTEKTIAKIVDYAKDK